MNKMVQTLEDIGNKGIVLSPNNYLAAATALIKVFGREKLLALSDSDLIKLICKVHEYNLPFDEQVKRIEDRLRTVDAIRDMNSTLQLTIAEIKKIVGNERKHVKTRP